MALQSSDLFIVQRNQQSYKMPASEILGIIPPAATVGDGTITIVQPGTSNQTFTVNQSGPTTITLKNDNTTYTAGNGIGLSGTEFSVAAGVGLTQDANGLSLLAITEYQVLGRQGGSGYPQGTKIVPLHLNGITGNGTSGQTLFSNGAGAFSWGDITPGGATYVQDTAPSGANPNELWFNSSEGRLYVYYNDGNTSQWVDASPDSYAYSDADVNAHLNQNTASAGQVLGWSGSDYQWVDQGSGVDSGIVYAALNYDMSSNTTYYSRGLSSFTEESTGTIRMNFAVPFDNIRKYVVVGTGVMEYSWGVKGPATTNQAADHVIVEHGRYSTGWNNTDRVNLAILT